MELKKEREYENLRRRMAEETKNHQDKKVYKIFDRLVEDGITKYEIMRLRRLLDLQMRGFFRKKK